MSSSQAAARSAPEPASDAPEAAAGSGPTPDLTRRGRSRTWDRPPSARDWRWWVGGVGKVLISIGLLMFGFVGYQLYGTGIETAAAQDGLQREFAQLLDATNLPTVSSTSRPTSEETAASTIPDADLPGSTLPDSTTPDGEAAEPSVDPVPVPVADQNLPDLTDGSAIGRIEIPEIGVDFIVVAGVSTADLKRGPGHFPDTPLPGQLGNSAIAGHRTTYREPFRHVDRLVPGDEIRMTTLNGVFVYRVTETQIVSSTDYQVVATTDPTRATLTLTSCHPVFTARQRIVISSELDLEASAAVGEPVLNYGRPPDAGGDEAGIIPGDDIPGDDIPGVAEPGATAPATTPTQDEPADQIAGGPTTDADRLGTTAVNSGIADAFDQGWFSDPAANADVGLWGVALSMIAIGAWAISRQFRRDWIGLVVGILPFVVVLYFFFQNVNRLLPPNL